MSTNWFKDMQAMHEKYGVNKWMSDEKKSEWSRLSKFMQFRLDMMQEELDETKKAFEHLGDAQETLGKHRKALGQHRKILRSTSGNI